MKKINNISESYCSFELSKLLKEFGFDSLCSMCYNGAFEPHHLKIIELGFKQSNSELIKDVYAAPTHALAIRWIRENFKIQLFPDYTYYDGFHYGYKWVKSNGDYGEFWKDNGDDPSGWDSLDEATEAALFEILRLIKRKYSHDLD